MFLHYGFVCEDAPTQGTVVVDDIVAEMINARPEPSRRAITELLNSHGYWM